MSTAPFRRSTVDHTPRERTSLPVDDADQGDTLRVLTSDTARSMLAALGGDPMPVSDLAEAVGTSVQNAQYHVERLVEADLVEPVDVWYSEKGREMSVYALTVGELVVQFDSAGT